MSDVAFRQLVLAKWLTPAQAAKKYGCSDRTVRLWLAKWGYVEGQNVAIAYRSAEGHYDRLAALAADLVRQRVNIIVATGGSGLTGISLLALDIGSKRVGLLRELIPNATTIALLLNPKSPDVGQHSRARPLPHHL
jgi:putative ABC transport system substrate-binding protein